MHGIHADYVSAEMPNAINNVKNNDSDLVPEAIKGYPTRMKVRGSPARSGVIRTESTDHKKAPMANVTGAFSYSRVRAF